MQDMNDILNPPSGETETVTTAETAETVENTASDKEQDITGETTQVAAETKTDAKDELAALTKERERIRKKEAELDLAWGELEIERKRLASQESQASPEQTGETKAEKKDLRAELRDLNKQYRTALQDSVLDPEDEETAKLVEELEDKMEEVRIAMLNEAQRTMTSREKADSDYRSTYAALHDEFPFLAPDHPQADADLNDDINTYITGRIQKGDSRHEALEKAVRRFAPAYAERMGISTASVGETDEKRGEPGVDVTRKLSRGGFSEVRSAGRTQRQKAFTGPTPMAAILGSKA